MNTKSFTLKVAVLGITAATVFLNAQSNGLSANVPMDFVLNGKTAKAGTYRVVEQRPGVVIVKSGAGDNLVIAMMSVQTETSSPSSKLTFRRQNGSHRLTGYCIAGRACWTATPAHTSSEQVEVALSVGR